MTLVQFAPALRAQPSAYARRWNPAVDILESDDGFTLSFDLPGLAREDININVKDGVLAVSGERKSASPEENNQYHHVERSTGAFSRSFQLPAFVDGAQIAARYEQGVLTLDIPKKAEAKPHLITVK